MCYTCMSVCLCVSESIKPNISQNIVFCLPIKITIKKTDTYLISTFVPKFTMDGVLFSNQNKQHFLSHFDQQVHNHSYMYTYIHTLLKIMCQIIMAQVLIICFSTVPISDSYTFTISVHHLRIHLPFTNLILNECHKM